MSFLLNRTLSRAVAAYPWQRGQTRLRKATSPWLVARLPFGAWARVSGVVDAEWDFLHRRTKEEATTRQVRSLLQPGQTFVDVGANVGYFTLMAASVVDKVVAYEPTPTVFRRLGENVTLNGFNRVELVDAAVADKPGTLQLHLSPDDPEANSLFGSAAGESVAVRVVTLDEDLAARNVGPVHLLKIDAEGAEPCVLDGAKGLLSSDKAPAVMIEVNPHALRIAGFAPSDVYDRLNSHRYVHQEIERFSYCGETVVNILATRPQ